MAGLSGEQFAVFQAHEMRPVTRLVLRKASLRLRSNPEPQTLNPKALNPKHLPVRGSLGDVQLLRLATGETARDWPGLLALPLRVPRR